MERFAGKKLAVIGASYLQAPLVDRARELGLEVHCFAWADGAVCKDRAHFFYPISIVEKEQILDICRKQRVDGICTIASDVAAPTVAYVAEAMGLPGNRYASALKASNKYLMRNAFLEAGVPCPQYWMVHHVDEVPQQAAFPLIVKPSDRSGSLAVSLVEDPKTLKTAVQQAVAASFKGEAMVEQYIDGREVSVEFISCKGRHYPLQITDKVTTGAPHFVELEHHQPAVLPAALSDELYATTVRALDALGITDGASHSEYKITADGRFYIMETGARMGGDFIGSDLVKLSTGYDFVQGVIEVALGCFQEPILPRKACSGVYFLCRESERLLPWFQHPESIPGLVRMERDDAPIRPVTKSADRCGFLIYSGTEKWQV